jgi:hypothetical protein
MDSKKPFRIHQANISLEPSLALLSDLHPLFPSMDRVVIDPHQSPIWFKASEFLPQHSAPSAFGGPENRRYHADSNGMLADHVVINQPLDGYRHRRIKIINRLWVQQVPIRPVGLLPTPKRVPCCTQIN